MQQHTAQQMMLLAAPAAPIIFRSSGLHTLDTYKPRPVRTPKQQSSQQLHSDVSSRPFNSTLGASAGIDAAVLAQAAAAAAAQTQHGSALQHHSLSALQQQEHHSSSIQNAAAVSAQQQAQEQQPVQQFQQQQQQQQQQAGRRRNATLRTTAPNDVIEIVPAPVLLSRLRPPAPEATQQDLPAPPHQRALASSAYGSTISPENIGFQLLRKAGWQEGTGLGVQQQGRVAPIPASSQRGNRGLGFDAQAAQSQQAAQAAQQQAVQAQLSRQKQQQQQQQGRDAVAGSGVRSAAGHGKELKIGPQLQVLGRRQRALLIQAELDSEDVVTKVKRYQQIARQEADDAKLRSIRSYLAHAFNEVEPSADVNPLSRPNRLTATNPLLDDEFD